MKKKIKKKLIKQATHSDLSKKIDKVTDLTLKAIAEIVKDGKESDETKRKFKKALEEAAKSL
jgi:hypothetical protein